MRTQQNNPERGATTNENSREEAETATSTAT
jgi:hypothetical protein